LPGLSRSGTTIATGLLLGDKKEEVAKFSFLMVIIPILGEAFLDLLKGMKEAPVADGSGIGATALIVGFVTAFVSGTLACKWMLKLVKNGKLVYFAAYCAIVGILTLVFLA
jgi:undecaprenyl-diphosphatase